MVFEDASVFRKFVDGVAALVEEAEFVVNKDGMSLKATDPSQISLVSLSLPASAFKGFEVEQPLKLGVDLNYLNQVMGRAKSGNSLELSVSEDNSKLLVTFSGNSKRSFSIPLLDLTTADLPMPKIEFSAELKIRAEALQDSFKDAALISTHIVLSVENDSFVLRANSSKGNLENVYANKDSQMISLKASEETKSMFPLDYLVSMIKACSSDTEVSVKLKSNAPVEVSYALGNGSLSYFLAPRIDTDN